ncbi:hypothetical protein MLD38_039036 [Melastoma candidum]|uniref:Uncharacterized protein n=1 Tax=Melastoma candidum TaxID=119954 RepID=A0ACB9L1K2_9MYRT|nr:hypothetical protein MLD38_039036 [Melastoma candidum]
MAAAATSTSMAAPAVLLPPRTTGASAMASRLSSSLCLSPLSFSSSSVKLLHTVSRKSSAFRIRASYTEESSSPDQLLTDLKEKWDAVENKSTVILYGGGAIVAIWLTSVVIGAVNSVPLLPKILELVGLGYTGWFVYRYLLFKSSRKELEDEIENLKKKIAGAN